MTDIKKSTRDERIELIQQLRGQGVNPYPGRFERTHTLLQALELPVDQAGVRVGGRIIAIRKMGKLSFAHIQDAAAKIQLCFTLNELGVGNTGKKYSIGDSWVWKAPFFSPRRAKNHQRQSFNSCPKPC